MAVHFLHRRAHIDRQQADLGMLMLKDNKKLVGKALPHPFEAVKIQQYFDDIYYGVILADTIVLI